MRIQGMRWSPVLPTPPVWAAELCCPGESDWGSAVKAKDTRQVVPWIEAAINLARVSKVGRPMKAPMRRIALHRIGWWILWAACRSPPALSGAHRTGHTGKISAKISQSAVKRISSPLKKFPKAHPKFIVQRPHRPPVRLPALSGLFLRYYPPSRCACLCACALQCLQYPPLLPPQAFIPAGLLRDGRVLVAGSLP